MRLEDLSTLRGAPNLDQSQRSSLFDQLLPFIYEADWFTVGIMASSVSKATVALKSLEACFQWPQFEVVQDRNLDGPVFLKANQNTGEVLIRVEYGLEDGILICCQNKDQTQTSPTLGPFPLDFFDR